MKTSYRGCHILFLSTKKKPLLKAIFTWWVFAVSYFSFHSFLLLQDRNEIIFLNTFFPNAIKFYQFAMTRSFQFRLLGLLFFVITYSLSKVLNYGFLRKVAVNPITKQKSKYLKTLFFIRNKCVSLVFLVIKPFVLKPVWGFYHKDLAGGSCCGLRKSLLCLCLNLCVCFFFFQDSCPNSCFLFRNMHVCISARLLSPCSDFREQLDALFQ